MTSIARLAQREAAAEAARGKADVRWRQAWWETTLALGEYVLASEIREAQSIVAKETGQSSGYVSKRTSTGRKFARLRKSVIKAPPRMAMEAASRNVEVNAALVTQMVAAERDGVSLRDFFTTLTGKGWADTPAGASQEAIRKMVQAQPEIVAAAVVEHSTARRAVEREQERRLVDAHPNILGRSPESADGKAFGARMAASNEAEAALSRRVYEATVLLQQVNRDWEEHFPFLSDVERGQMERSLRDLIVEAESVRLSLGMEVSS